MFWRIPNKNKCLCSVWSLWVVSYKARVTWNLRDYFHSCLKVQFRRYVLSVRFRFWGELGTPFGGGGGSWREVAVYLLFSLIFVLILNPWTKQPTVVPAVKNMRNLYRKNTETETHPHRLAWGAGGGADVPDSGGCSDRKAVQANVLKVCF